MEKKNYKPDYRGEGAGASEVSLKMVILYNRVQGDGIFQTGGLNKV